VVWDVQLVEELPPLRRDGDPGARPGAGPQAADVLAVEVDLAGGGHRAVRGEEETALARAVRADDRGDRTASRGHRDVSERAGLSIADAQAFDPQLMSGHPAP